MPCGKGLFLNLQPVDYNEFFLYLQFYELDPVEKQEHVPFLWIRYKKGSRHSYALTKAEYIGTMYLWMY